MGWFANWQREREIARLKRRARAAAATMNEVVANMDCGHHLASFIRVHGPA